MNPKKDEPATASDLRWGIVGTGYIADLMAPMIRAARNAHLQAVSSRRLDTARDFAARCKIEQAFGSWQELVAAPTVDAVYVATPTTTKEAIAVAAARAGKHVLVEKPFEGLGSLQRIVAACRERDVAFMDATRFSHSPRTAQIRALLAGEVGRPWSVASAFQFELKDTDNIRYDPALEPYGAIGDIGWYCMRAAAEYLDPDIELVRVAARLLRHPPTGAVVRGGGLLVFDDDSQSTWECGFESGAGIMDLRISGPRGVIKLDDFALQRPADRPARFEIRRDWEETRTAEVDLPRPEAALMFENFAALTNDPEAREASVRTSERTQRWLDAAWAAARRGETPA